MFRSAIKLALLLLACLIVFGTVQSAHASPRRGFVGRTVRALAIKTMRLEVKGLEHLPQDGAMIFAPTHQSYLDHLAVAAATPRFPRFMATKGLFKYRWSNVLFRALKMIPTNRANPAANRDAMRSALAQLASGGPVAIYPEGGVEKGLSLFDGGQLKRGVAFLGRRSGAPIIPMLIKLRWKGNFGLPRSVEFGKPIDPAGKSEETLLSEVATAMLKMHRGE